MSKVRCFVFIMSMMSCIGAYVNAASQVQTVYKRIHTKHLYYNGALIPGKVFPVLSSVKGRVVSVFFQYGDKIHKEAKLLSISASQLTDDFHASFQSYLHAKDQVQQAKDKYKSQQMLFKYGLVSKNELASSQYAYKSSELDFFSTVDKLYAVIENLQGFSFNDIMSQTTANSEAVKKMLQKKFNDAIVKASHEGVVLFPDEGSADQAVKGDGRVRSGDQVEKQQLLLQIGELDSFRTKINVSQADVNLIKPGMRVVATSTGFPGRLVGSVESVAVQANKVSSQATSSRFDVTIHLKDIPPSSKGLVRVGMIAQMDLVTQEKPSIEIPFGSVISRQGNYYVKKKMKDGSFKEVLITLGMTTVRGVMVQTGLQNGDQILVPVREGRTGLRGGRSAIMPLRENHD